MALCRIAPWVWKSDFIRSRSDAGTIPVIWNFICSIIVAMWHLICGIVAASWAFPYGIMKALWRYICSIAISFWTLVSSLVEASSILICHDIPAIVHRRTVSSTRLILNFARGMLKAPTEFVCSVFKAFWELINDIRMEIWNFAKCVFKTLWCFICNVIKELWHLVSRLLVANLTFMVHLVNEIWCLLFGLGTASLEVPLSILDTIRNTFSQLVKDYSNVISVMCGAYNVYKKIKAMWDFFCRIPFKAVWNMIHGIAKAARNLIVSIVKSIWKFLLAIWFLIVNFFFGSDNGGNDPNSPVGTALLPPSPSLPVYRQPQALPRNVQCLPAKASQRNEPGYWKHALAMGSAAAAVPVLSWVFSARTSSAGSTSRMAFESEDIDSWWQGESSSSSRTLSQQHRHSPLEQASQVRLGVSSAAHLSGDLTPHDVLQRPQTPSRHDGNLFDLFHLGDSTFLGSPHRSPSSSLFPWGHGSPSVSREQSWDFSLGAFRNSSQPLRDTSSSFFSGHGNSSQLAGLSSMARTNFFH